MLARTQWLRRNSLMSDQPHTKQDAEEDGPRLTDHGANVLPASHWAAVICYQVTLDYA